MRRTFLRQLQSAAKAELITIAEQQYNNKENIWEQQTSSHIQIRPYQKLVKNKKIQTQLRVHTQLSSPRVKNNQSSKQSLKLQLQELKKKSTIYFQNRQSSHQKQKESHQVKSVPLKSLNLNNQSHRTVQQIYLSKQISEQKIRPVVYVDDFQKQYEQQQQKLRTIIKRKIMAKDLFRRLKFDRNQSSILVRHQSQKPNIKRNFIMNKNKNILPHIF